MAKVTEVGITAGVGTTGTGTAATLDGIYNRDAGPVVIATAAAVTATSLFIPVAMAVTGTTLTTAFWDKGSGTGGSATQRVIIDTSQVGLTASANGATTSRVTNTTAGGFTNIKASAAGNIYRIDIFNTSATGAFFKLYNNVGVPTTASTPIWTIPIPANVGYSKTFPYGLSFSSGIAYSITGLIADNDATTVTAGVVVGSIDWI
jgi:hypothetical protein